MTWITLIIIGRLIPHVANFVPIFTIVSLLLIQHGRLKALSIFIPTLFISDCLLWIIKGYSLNGNWLIINYLSYLLFFVLPLNNYKVLRHGGVMFPVVFWMVSNYLIWQLTPYYDNDFSGLVNCYWFALPFLGTSLLANSIFGLLIERFQRKSTYDKLLRL